MREILFRGKTLINMKETWVYGDLMHFDDGDKYIYNKNKMQYNIIENGYQLFPETVGQYTGLTDKNGKKIFEGDILLSRYKDKVEDSGYGSIYNEVAFTNGSFGMIGENTGDIIPFSEYPATEEVVVGNIYDNPFLLK